MKDENQPYSKTGKFVENLKTTQTSSDDDIELYSKYTKIYSKELEKYFFKKQLFGIGKDIMYTNNLLIQYGFTKQRPPIPEQGSSQYSLTDKNDTILVGFWNGICIWKSWIIFMAS